jgi:hypothetical protein
MGIIETQLKHVGYELDMLVYTFDKLLLVVPKGKALDDHSGATVTTGTFDGRAQPLPAKQGRHMASCRVHRQLSHRQSLRNEAEIY